MQKVVLSHAYSKNKDILDLIRVISYIGRTLESARPIELPISNAVRRCLHIIRDTAAQLGVSTVPQRKGRSNTTTRWASLR